MVWGRGTGINLGDWGLPMNDSLDSDGSQETARRVRGSLVQPAMARRDMTRYACLNGEPESRPDSSWDGRYVQNRSGWGLCANPAAGLPGLLPAHFSPAFRGRGVLRRLQGRGCTGMGYQSIRSVGNRPTGLPPLFRGFSGVGQKCYRGWGGWSGAGQAGGSADRQGHQGRKKIKK